MGQICSWQQVALSLLCNVATLTYGLQTGWLSPLQPILQSKGNPIGDHALTDEEISWIGSLPSITLIFSAPIFGWTMDRFGRKWSLFLTTAPNIVTYLLLIFANDVNIIYASRLIGGFCSCGAFIVGPIFVSECVQSNVKGFLGCLTGFFVKLGMILSYTFGAYTSYLTLNLISLSFTVIFVICFFWIPESPEFLLRNDKEKEAKLTLKKLWALDNDNLIIEEIKKLNDKMIGPKVGTLEILKKFIFDRRVRKASLIVASIFAFQMLSGYGALVRYTVDIFDNAGSSFSPYIAAVILAVSQLLFSCVGAFSVDKVGRKLILIISLSIMATAMGSLSIFLFLKGRYPESEWFSHLSLLPTILLVIFIGCYATAFGTVPFIIIPELFTAETRATASTVLNLWFAFVEFVVVKFFLGITNLIDLTGSLGVFSVFGYIGVIVFQCIMFETSGLSFEEIQKKLDGKSPSVDEEKSKEKLLLKQEKC